MTTRLVVDRIDLTSMSVQADDAALAPLAEGEVRLACDLFGLSANNISYARAGDFLGYWSFFPVDAQRGCIPVWGFADVVESANEQLEVGSRVFGYLPMASHFIAAPDNISDLTFIDAQAHRSSLHPWYNRYYRCASDPAYRAETEPLQAVLWALFLTGWELAAQLAPSVDNVVVSSASSKTATALAYALQQIAPSVNVVGLTSAPNEAFVASADVFDAVVTYDDLSAGSLDGALAPGGTCAYVDTAGNASITAAVHASLGERLVDSVLVGGTHQGAGGSGGELVGPAPRFFFIPDIADASAAAEGAEAYHERFVQALVPFLSWSAQRLTIERGAGTESVVQNYQRVLGYDFGPDVAVVLNW